MQVRYRKTAPDEPEHIKAFGKSFKAGKWNDLDDQYAGKVRGNPSFEVKGETTYGDEPAKENKAQDELDAALAADQEAQRKARALEQAKGIDAAKRSPDRDATEDARRAAAGQASEDEV